MMDDAARTDGSIRLPDCVPPARIPGVAGEILPLLEQEGLLHASLHVAELDAVTTEQVRPVLHELGARAAGRKILLDLADVSFIQSMGVGLLVDLNNQLHATQGRLILYNLHPRVRTLLHLTRLDQVVVIAADLGEARRCAES